MQQALALAEQAKSSQEVPIGAVVVLNDKKIAQSYNQPISTSDPTAHAEILALREAGKNQQNYRLPGCRVFVTLQPCQMCLSAMEHARIQEVIFGAFDPKKSLSQQTRFRQTGGVLEKACRDILVDFFLQRR